MADEQIYTAALDPETGEIIERPMTDEERSEFLATRDADLAAALVNARAVRVSIVEGALAATDRWAARAFEEGEPMRPERVAYRQELRKLIAAIETSDDPASIELPKEPA